MVVQFIYSKTVQFPISQNTVLAVNVKMATDLVGMFTSIGLSEQKATETLKNEQLAKFLKEIIVEVSKALH